MNKTQRKIMGKWKRGGRLDSDILKFLVWGTNGIGKSFRVIMIIVTWRRYMKGGFKDNAKTSSIIMGLGK